MNAIYTLPSRAVPLDRTGYRKAISRFPTGIAIVSCEQEEGGVHGMTISSFTSISLDPPTVMISLKAGRMHSLVNQQSRFGVSILREDQQHFSGHFGGNPDPGITASFVVQEQVPTLADSLAWFECAVTERIQVQDHTLFIAQVVACGYGDCSPLIYFASGYHRPALEVS